MNYASTASLVTAAGMFGVELNRLVESLAAPRDQRLALIQALQTTYDALQAELMMGLEARDKMIQLLDSTEQALAMLEKQVKVMKAELLAMQARLDRIEDGDDRPAPRH